MSENKAQKIALGAAEAIGPSLLTTGGSVVIMVAVGSENYHVAWIGNPLLVRGLLDLGSEIIKKATSPEKLPENVAVDSKPVS